MLCVLSPRQKNMADSLRIKSTPWIVQSFTVPKSTRKSTDIIMADTRTGARTVVLRRLLQSARHGVTPKLRNIAIATLPPEGEGGNGGLRRCTPRESSALKYCWAAGRRLPPVVPGRLGRPPVCLPYARISGSGGCSTADQGVRFAAGLPRLLLMAETASPGT